MSDTSSFLRDIMSQTSEADITALRSFLLSDPGKPLVATGSGGAESVADFAALLYSARGGVGTAVSPYTMNSCSDEALRTSKQLLVSAGGHNNDIPGKRGHDGFVSIGTPVKYFALLCKAFDPGCDLAKYSEMPRMPFRIERNDGTPLKPGALRGISSLVVLHGSWGRPVALNLEGKLVESGLSTAMVTDYRNYCHGRFIYTSNHLEDSAVVMLVSPRERYIAERTRRFLPARTRLVIIETGEDSPEASLDLIVRSTGFFFALCEATGTDYVSPSNPGKIDKRVPMWVPFISEMKKNGPLAMC